MNHDMSRDCRTCGEGWRAEGEKKCRPNWTVRQIGALFGPVRPTKTRRNASCAYTQAQMDVGSAGALAGILIVILVAVYIWLVRSGHGD
jgi:hypothetical protein